MDHCALFRIFLSDPHGDAEKGNIPHTRKNRNKNPSICAELFLFNFWLFTSWIFQDCSQWILGKYVTSFRPALFFFTISLYISVLFYHTQHFSARVNKMNDSDLFSNWFGLFCLLFVAYIEKNGLKSESFVGILI